MNPSALMSALWRLNTNDFLHGAISAIAAAVLAAFGGIVLSPHFDLFTVDWASILHTAVNAGFAGFVGYLTVRFSTDSSGKVFGRL